MTFEDQLIRAFQTLTERLRGDIDLQVQRTSAELIAAATRDRDRAASVGPSTTEEMEIVVAGLAAGTDAGRREALKGGAGRPVDVASRERLADAVRSVERARSLTEILDTLVSCVRMEAARADVWLIRGGRLHQWRSPRSHGGGTDHVPAHSLDEDRIVAEAARTNAVAAADGTLAVPIAIAGQCVAVLFADLGEPGSENLEPGTGHHERTVTLEPRTSNLELLVRYAARSLEALTAFTIARALTERPVEPDDPNAAQPADKRARKTTRRRGGTRACSSPKSSC